MAAGEQLSARGRFWLKHLERWKQSGLSQAQYCREHKLSVPAFGWWKGRLSFHRKGPQPRATMRKRTDPDGTFVELSLPDAGRPGTANSVVYEIALAHDRRLRLGPGFEPERVRQLLEVLEGAC